MTKRLGRSSWCRGRGAAIGKAAHRLLRRVVGEEGASIVEMAIASSLVFAMMFGVIQMSLALYTYHFVSDAAREGSRWAMVRGGSCISNVSKAYCSPTSADANGADNSDIQAYVQSLGYPYASNLTTSTKWLSGTPSAPVTCGTTPSGCNTAGNQVQVTVSYSFPIAIPFWTATTINLQSASTMVIAQ